MFSFCSFCFCSVGHNKSHRTWTTATQVLSKYYLFVLFIGVLPFGVSATVLNLAVNRCLQLGPGNFTVHTQDGCQYTYMYSVSPYAYENAHITKTKIRGAAELMPQQQKTWPTLS